MVEQVAERSPGLAAVVRLQQWGGVQVALGRSRLVGAVVARLGRSPSELGAVVKTLLGLEIYL